MGKRYLADILETMGAYVSWRTEVPARIANALGLEKVMFEAAEPEVFRWYVKNYGPDLILPLSG